MAQDLAENNKGARVLVVCSEITAVTFRGPSDTDHVSLNIQALIGDGAAAVVVGSDPIQGVEKPLLRWCGLHKQSSQVVKVLLKVTFVRLG